MRGKIGETVKDQKTADALKPNDHPTWYSPQAHSRPISTTSRDLQPPERHLGEPEEDPDRGNHRHRRAHRRGRVRGSTPCVLATGFDAMTGALLADDIGRARTARTSASLRGPEGSSRPRRGGLPTLLITGPGSSQRALQHDQLHRAARGMDRRLPGSRASMASRGSRPTKRPRRPGSPTCAGWPTRRSSRAPPPGTWAPTSPWKPCPALHRLRPPTEVRRRGRQGVRRVRARQGAQADAELFPDRLEFLSDVGSTMRRGGCRTGGVSSERPSWPARRSALRALHRRAATPEAAG